MYGSRKPNMESYKITYIFDKDMNAKEINSDHTEYVEILSIRNKFDLTDVKPEYEKIEETYEKDQHKKFVMKNTSIFQPQQNIKKNTITDIDYVKTLVNILDDDRANNYQKWIRLGWCLRNIDHRLLEVWNEFSKRCPKFQEGECERIWNYMKDDGLNIGSLHLWAKEDNPEEYKQLVKKGINTLLNTSISTITHTDIARVVYELFKYEYVCVSVSKNIWYEFRNHKWVSCDSGTTLRSKISKELCDEYYNYRAVLSQQAASTIDTDQRDNIDKKIKKIGELILKLKTVSFKDNIMKESREVFYIEKFEEKLDSRCHLIGFENGVFDLDSYEFREGRPEDYISFTTGINYIPYTDDENSQMMEGFINRIFPKIHMKEYFLTLLSSFLNGNIKEERFHILTGTGANGKSKILDLFEQSFGDYCCKLPITLLTQKRAASNAATGELARTKGKRFACLQEPSQDEKLNIGLMKELTGGDKIMARAMYKDPIEFKPQFKMVLTCNQLPTVPSTDNGTWRRLRVIEFTSKFVDVPNPANANEFIMDCDLSNNFIIWKEYFISLLINYYKKYVEIGITEPDEVLYCTKEYQRNNDVFLDFVEQELIRDEMEFVSYNQVLNSIKGWIKDNNITHISPKKKDLEINLKKCLGETVRYGHVDGFKGWKLKIHSLIVVDELD
jgi:P4 family phage/plasmid primase-like protien